MGEVRLFPGIDFVLHDVGEDSGRGDWDVFFRLENIGLGELGVGRGRAVVGVARRLMRERALGFEQSRRIILSRVVRRRWRKLL